MKNSKTKKILSILLAVIMVVGMIPATTLTAFAESTTKIDGVAGSGTKGDPYVVENITKLQEIEALAIDEVYVKLGADLYSKYSYRSTDLYVNVDTHLDMNGYSLYSIYTYVNKTLEITGKGEMDHLQPENGGTAIVKGNIVFYWDIKIYGTLIFDNPELSHTITLYNGSEFVLKQGTVTNIDAEGNGSITMYGGKFDDDFCYNHTRRDPETGAYTPYHLNLAFYGGEIAPSEVDQDRDNYQVGGEGEYTLTNTSYAFFEDGTNKKIASYDDLEKAILYGKFTVCAPHFVEQSPAVPEKSNTCDLGKIEATSYLMAFKGNKVPVIAYSIGYRTYETLKVYNNNAKLVDECSNDTQNGEGLTYNLNKLPQGTYSIIETVTLVDKNGNELLSEQNTFVVNWRKAVNTINIRATFSGTPADATTSTTGAAVTATKWYRKNGSGWTELGASDTIKEGYTYRCEVTVAAADGYQLADGYTVKIYGTAATKKSGNTWYRDVTITGISDYVEVNDIDLPEAYTNPDFTYNDEEGAAYHWDVVQVEWFECDKDGHILSGALTENDVFKKNTYYRIEVTVVPETNWQFHGSQLSFYINGKAAMPLYGYNKAYPDSVTGYLVYNTADIEGDYELFVYDDSLSGSAKNIYIKDGQYLGSNATGATATKPASGGYAYYKDGVLELNGYKNEKAHFIFEELALELYLVGDNTIGAIYDNEFGMAGGNLETRQGNLVIDAADGGKLTIASNPLDAYANIQVKDLYFNGGELTSCLANGTYGAAVQLNGGNLYLEDGYVAYVSDTNDFASATKWDGKTDIGGYDCVWIVEKQETILNVNLSSYLGESDFITLALYDKNMDILHYHYTLRGNTSSYSFPAVPYGEYVIVAEKPGHVPYQCTIVAEDDALYQNVELNLYADTNLDGEIDENDYQALVNAVLQDDHEQIETEEYDDLIQYDLVMDGYLDALDAAVMALVVNGHRTIDEVYDIKKGDYDYDGEAFTESDLIAMYHVLSDIDSSAPTLSTSQKFASDLNYNGKVDEGDLAILTGRYGTIEETTCEENIKVYYRWGNSYTTCTATAICTICDKHVAKETVNSVKNADGSYTATFTNTLLGTKTYSSK